MWRIPADGGAERDLTPHPDLKPNPEFDQKSGPQSDQQKINSIVWPKENTPDAIAPPELILAAGEGESTSLYRLTLANGELKPISKPTEFATLAATSQKSGALLFAGSSRNGDWLWLGKKDSDKFNEVVHVNSFLDGVAEGKMKLIEYNSLDGKPLKAWLMLPIDYKEA